MKRIVLALFPLALVAQTHVKTPPLRFDMDASAMPSKIDYISKSLHFVDTDGDNTIGANEECAIQFRITNNGDGDGHGCEARINMEGTQNGISCLPVRLPRINKGDTIVVNYPIKTNHLTQNGKVQFTMEIYEPNGFGTGDISLSVATHQFDPPRVEVGQYVVTSDKQKLERKEKFTLQIPVQNLAQGIAEDVKISIKCPSGISLLSNNHIVEIPRLLPNEAQIITYELIPTVNAPENLPFEIEVDEKYGKYAKGADINLQLGKQVLIASAIQSTHEEVEIKRLSLISDVDENIPKTDKNNLNTFVLIIANEKYQQVASVPFALNDGKVFRKYCEQTLGIPSKNIREYTNATGNQMKFGVNLLRDIVDVYSNVSNPQIIVYYAGHGIPDESSRTAYLLPVDGIISDMSTCYKLDDLYTTLGALPASQITVFMDACFSGSKREDGMIASARGVALKAKSGVPQGNMVVFSAAQGDETAYPNREQQHGLFTYYLLKKLQETQGDIALKDLGDYITKQVSQQSLLLNSKKQTPCVTPSVTLGDQWQNWKLK